MKKLKVNIGKKSLILIAVVVVLVAVDLLTKYFEEKYFWNFKVIPHFIEVMGKVRNPGCAFSFLDDNPEIGQPLLITMTFVLLAVLVFGFTVLPERFTLLKVAVALVISGAVGNLADRLMFREVRDFVGLNMFGTGMVYCNFADFFIVIGTAIALLDLIFLNEWALIPLTKKAKAAQAEHKQKAEQADKEAEKEKEDGE